MYTCTFIKLEELVLYFASSATIHSAFSCPCYRPSSGGSRIHKGGAGTLPPSEGKLPQWCPPQKPTLFITSSSKHYTQTLRSKRQYGIYTVQIITYFTGIVGPMHYYYQIRMLETVFWDGLAQMLYRIHPQVHVLFLSSAWQSKPCMRICKTFFSNN